MSKKAISILGISLIISSSIFYACTKSEEVNTKIRPEVTHKMDLENLKSRNMGQVTVNINTSAMIKNKFNTKSVNFTNKAIRKLKLEVVGLGVGTGFSQTIKWSPNTTASFSLGVPAGTNRVMILKALDAQGKTIAQLMGALDVNVGQNNNGKISYFDTKVAQSLLGVLNSKKPDLINKLDLKTLNTFFTNATGYNPTTNTFTKVEPAFVNSSFVSNNVLNNNGTLPSETDPNLNGIGSVKVTLNVEEAELILADLKSNRIISTTGLVNTITNSSIGEWDLTIKKDGYKDQTIKVNVTGLDTPVNVVLEKLDLRTETVLNKPQQGKILNEQYDEETGVTLLDYSFKVGTDTDNDGGENESAEATLQIDGLSGIHKVSLSQEDFPVMDNRDDLLITKDITNGITRTFSADQELLKFKISDGQTSITIETNPDGTYVVNGENAQTDLDGAKLAMKYPVFSDSSPYSLAVILELFSLNGKIDDDVETAQTLSPINCKTHDDEIAKVGTTGDPQELLKEGLKLLIEKNKAP